MEAPTLTTEEETAANVYRCAITAYPYVYFPAEVTDRKTGDRRLCRLCVCRGFLCHTHNPEGHVDVPAQVRAAILAARDGPFEPMSYMPQ